MSIVKKTFGGSEVAFEPFVTENNVMVNATQMAKAYGKEVYDFLRINGTQKLIEAYCQTEDLRYGDEFSPHGKVVKIQKGDPSVSGTWMNRILAIKFAAWLDPFFELWILKTIDEIMFGYSREQDQSIQRTLIIQHEMKQIEKNPERSGEDFDLYMKLQNQLVYERTIRSAATKQRFREFYKTLSPSFKTS